MDEAERLQDRFRDALDAANLADDLVEDLEVLLACARADRSPDIICAAREALDAAGTVADCLGEIRKLRRDDLVAVPGGEGE